MMVKIKMIKIQHNFLDAVSSVLLVNRENEWADGVKVTILVVVQLFLRKSLITFLKFFGFLRPTDS